MWTIGVSKIRKDPECILNGDGEEVNFELCTDPAAILYQSTTGRSRVLPYGGFTVARSPIGLRMFFLSVLSRDEDDEGHVVSANVWIAPEGALFSRSPKELQSIGRMPISGAFFEEEVEDTGTIRLHVDDEGVPDHICRTLFNVGVHCFPIAMQDYGTIHILESETEFVSMKQLHETCYSEVLNKDYWTAKVSTVATGLEVFWDNDGKPEKVVFGCFGTQGGVGNFTTADSEGNLTHVLNGAYAGSILMGVDFPEEVTSPAKETNKNPEGVSVAPSVALLFCFLVATSLFIYTKVSGRQVVRLGTNRLYAVDGRDSNEHDEEDNLIVFSGTASHENRSRTSYFELSTVEPVHA